MKILCLAGFVAGISALICFPFAESIAAGKYIHKTYNQRLTKSRAEEGSTNNGTVIYNYQVIDSYDDSLSGEDIGNLEVEKGSHVRRIHNVVIINDEVESTKNDLEIGKIKVERLGRVRRVDNSVTIKGGIDASGNSIEIGRVRVKKGGRISVMNNQVEIDGDIDVHQ